MIDNAHIFTKDETLKAEWKLYEVRIEGFTKRGNWWEWTGNMPLEDGSTITFFAVEDRSDGKYRFKTNRDGSGTYNCDVICGGGGMTFGGGTLSMSRGLQTHSAQTSGVTMDNVAGVVWLFRNGDQVITLKMR